MKKQRGDNTATERSRLKWRYCLWFYKTVKEAFDRIERKETQLEIDHALMRSLGNVKPLGDHKRWQQLCDEFQSYIAQKETALRQEKFDASGKNPTTEYLFLKHKLRGLECVIEGEFGKQGLRRIQELYEQEMEKRILSEREHR